MVFASQIACLLFLKLIIQTASKPPWLLRSCFQLPRKCSGKKNVKASLLTSLLPSLLASLLPSLLASTLGESDPTLGGGGPRSLEPHTYIYMLIELGRPRVSAHHLSCGGEPVDCSYVAHTIYTLSINHDILAQALNTGVFGLKSS